MKLLLCLCLLLALPTWAEERAAAGRIDEAQGDVRIYDAARAARAVKTGEAVYEGDSIVTGSDGEVHLAMADEGQLALRPNTRMSIAKYRAEGGSGDTSVFSLVQGALRSVTGWIGKYNAKGYAVRTPTATIGVRGTDHETVVIPEGSHDGEPGTYDKVNHGATLLTTKHGQTEVRPNQAAFASFSGRQRPQLLAAVPHFFRPARLDGRFENLHEKVRQRIDAKRNERIEAIRERRLKSDPARSERKAGIEQRRKAIEARRQGREAGERQFGERRSEALRERIEERRGRIGPHAPGDTGNGERQRRPDRREHEREGGPQRHGGGRGH